MSDTPTTNDGVKVMIASCETCAFFKNDFSYYDKETAAGQCRRHAPVPLTVVEEEESSVIAVWPMVTYTDWCGEWEPKYDEDDPTLDWKNLI